jgi:hypothetical protein
MSYDVNPLSELHAHLLTNSLTHSLTHSTHKMNQSSFFTHSPVVHGSGDLNVVQMNTKGTILRRFLCTINLEWIATYYFRAQTFRSYHKDTKLIKIRNILNFTEASRPTHRRKK